LSASLDWYAGTERHGFRDLSTPVRDEGRGPVVLCLHGFPTSSWDFEPVAVSVPLLDHLAARHAR
jgi:pimeloyl-ACP methyl ester carboxylesterase